MCPSSEMSSSTAEGSAAVLAADVGGMKSLARMRAEPMRWEPRKRRSETSIWMQDTRTCLREVRSLSSMDLAKQGKQQTSFVFGRMKLMISGNRICTKPSKTACCNRNIFLIYISILRALRLHFHRGDYVALLVYGPHPNSPNCICDGMICQRYRKCLDSQVICVNRIVRLRRIHKILLLFRTSIDRTLLSSCSIG